MKHISIGAAISIAVALAIVTIAQPEDSAEFQLCAHSGSFESYEVLEAQCLAELKDQVKQGIGKPGWQPQGGVVYDPKTTCYLQVMVHPRKLPSYP